MRVTRAFSPAGFIGACGAGAGGGKPKGWDSFYRRFPDSSGLITISRVGIDSKGTMAIIYLGQQRQYLDGSGSICILKREGKKWVRIADGIGGRWRS
jgi:hypothetical protein